MKRLALIFLAAIILVSCNSDTYSRLQEIESYMENEPKRALEELRQMNAEEIKGARNIAKHALLHSMALDKNYIDLKTDSIIAPAVKYYSKKGSADDRLLMHYYMGRIHANAGNWDKAAIEYSKGEELVGKAKNKLAVGRLYAVFSTIYNKTNNAKKEIEYAQKGCDYLKEMSSIKHLNIAKGKLAMAYANGRLFNEADSLFGECIEVLIEDTISMVNYLGHYARLNVLKPDPDPNKALLLLERRQKEYNRTYTPDLYCVYAYAQQQLGRESECDRILGYLKEINYKELDFWQYRIYKHRQQYKQAMAHLEHSSREYEYKMISLLSDNTDNALKDYYSSEAERAKMEMQMKVMILVLIILSVVIVLSAIVIKLMHNNRKRQREMKAYLNMYENASKLVLDYENRLGKQIAQTYKNQFSTIGDLCLTYLTKQDKKNVKDHIYRKVEKLIANISSDEKMHLQLEKQLNADLDNIIVHLREDLPKLTNNDMRFICYCIVGFDATLISVIFNLSIENVYTKKSRLKAKINALNSPYKEQYMLYIS